MSQRTTEGSLHTVNAPGSRVPIANPIATFFRWASKTDERAIRWCAWWSRSTQAAFGFFVCFTAAVASCAIYYTLRTINLPDPWASCGALCWGLFIFFIDREIIGSPSPNTIWARPVLALIVGTVVAVPVELWVFQDRVDQELSRQFLVENKDALQRRREMENDLERRHSDLTAELTGLQQEQQAWGKVMDAELVGRTGDGRTGIAGAGPVYQNAFEQQRQAEQRARDVRQDLDNLDKSRATELNRIDQRYVTEVVPKVTSFTTRYEAMQKVTSASPALRHLSWGVLLFFILIELTPATMALFKFMMDQSDYQHLVNAEIRENIVRINRLTEQNLDAAEADPMTPEPSVLDKFAYVRVGRQEEF